MLDQSVLDWMRRVALCGMFISLAGAALVIAIELLSSLLGSIAGLTRACRVKHD